MPLFTPQNAREMAQKSHEARRQSAIAESPPACLPHLSLDVASVYARLETLDRLMSQAESSKQWDELSRSYERLFKVWAWLTRTPGPGQYKPERVTGRRGLGSSFPPGFGSVGSEVTSLKS